MDQVGTPQVIYQPLKRYFKVFFLRYWENLPTRFFGGLPGRLS